MDILILSRFAFEGLMRKKDITPDNVESLKDVFFISIQNDSGDNHLPYFIEDKQNVLVQYFSDVHEDVTDKYGTHTAFTTEHAEEMNQFIQRHKEKKACIIHCTAGVSRSGAVGAYVAEVLGIKYLDYIAANPMVQPNSHVLNMLRKTQEFAVIVESRHLFEENVYQPLHPGLDGQIIELPLSMEFEYGDQIYCTAYPKQMLYVTTTAQYFKKESGGEIIEYWLHKVTMITNHPSNFFPAKYLHAGSMFKKLP